VELIQLSFGTSYLIQYCIVSFWFDNWEVLGTIPRHLLDLPNTRVNTSSEKTVIFGNGSKIFDIDFFLPKNPKNPGVTPGEGYTPPQRRRDCFC
jgi:hypothetical protein